MLRPLLTPGGERGARRVAALIWALCAVMAIPTVVLLAIGRGNQEATVCRLIFEHYSPRDRGAFATRGPADSAEASASADNRAEEGSRQRREDAHRATNAARGNGVELRVPLAGGERASLFPEWVLRWG